MSSLRSRPYDPLNSGNAPRIKAETWQLFRDKITTLHFRRRTKNEILDELRSDVGAKLLDFSPTLSQLRLQMGKWELCPGRQCGSATTQETPSSESSELLPTVDEHSVKKVETPDVTQSSSGNSSQALQDKMQPSVLDTSPVRSSIPDGHSMFGKVSTPVDHHLAHFLAQRPDDLSHQNVHCINMRRNPQLSPILETTPEGGAQWRLSGPATPPLTVGDSSSEDDSFSSIGKSETIASGGLAEELQDHPYMSLLNYACSNNFDLDGTLMNLVTLCLTNADVKSESLLTLWPEAADPSGLQMVQVYQIRGTATALAAAGIYDDAFSLFHVEYLFWRACTMRFARHDSMQGMITATVDCARTCGPGARTVITRQHLLEVLELMQKYDCADYFDSALLHLYLAELPDKETNLNHSYELDTAFRTLHEVGDCFKMLAPEIQDREYIYMSEKFRQSYLLFARQDRMPYAFSQVIQQKVVRQQIPSYDHLKDCKDVTLAFGTLLQWCKQVLQKHRHAFDAPGNWLPATIDFPPSAIWLVFSCCVSEAISFKPIAQVELIKSQVPLCGHGGRPLRLNTLLALAIITEHFLSCYHDRMRRLLVGSELCDFLIQEIEGIQSSACPEVILEYLARVTKLPISHGGTNRLDHMSSLLVKQHLKAAVQAHRSSMQAQSPRVSQHSSVSATSVHPVTQGGLRSSKTASTQSSTNTIRSSASTDVKQMHALKHEIKHRFHLPFTFRSVGRGDNFELVTGMPFRGPPTDDKVEILDPDEIGVAMTIDTIDHTTDETRNVDMGGFF